MDLTSKDGEEVTVFSIPEAEVRERAGRPAVFSVSKLEQLVHRHFQRVRDAKDDIQGGAGLCQLDIAYVVWLNIYHFCKLFLSQFPFAAVVINIQAKCLIFFNLQFIHAITVYSIG